MKKSQFNSKGFSHHFALFFFILIFAVAGVGYRVATKAASETEPTNTYFMYSEGGKYKYVYVWGHGRCGTKTVKYTASSQSNALAFKMPSKDSAGNYPPIKLICTANSSDSYSFDFRVTSDETGSADVSGAGEDLVSSCIYVHDSGVSRTGARENGSCNTDSAKSAGDDDGNDSSNNGGDGSSDDGPVATTSGAPRPDRGALLIARHIAGKELSNKLGIGTNEDRTYIISVQGPGRLKNREPRVFNSKITDNPISGVKVKLSSQNRSKRAGCGYNGPFNRHRDSTKVTNGNGDVAFVRCTKDDFSLTLSNIPVGYVLPGQQGRSPALNIKDGRYIQLERIKADGFDGVLITITLQHRTTLAPFTQAQMTSFAAAASKYWHQVTPTEAQRRIGTIDIDQTTTCKPNQVQYAYDDAGNRGRSADALAWAKAGGGKPGRPKSQCTITWNTDESSYEFLKDNINVTACMAFVHEYGHLLGHVAVKEVKSNGEISFKIGHSSNPDNIMYATLNPNNGHLIKETGCH